MFFVCPELLDRFFFSLDSTAVRSFQMGGMCRCIGDAGVSYWVINRIFWEREGEREKDFFTSSFTPARKICGFICSFFYILKLNVLDFIQTVAICYYDFYTFLFTLSRICADRNILRRLDSYSPFRLWHDCMIFFFKSHMLTEPRRSSVILSCIKIRH